MNEKVKKIMMRMGGVMLVLLIAYGGYFMLTKKSEPEITEVPSVSSKEIKSYFPMESEATVKDMAHQMERAKEKQAPQYHYYSVTQKQADDKAKEYAKAQKADKVVKESREVVIKDDAGKTTSVIENDYYAINLERKHEVKVGAAMVDGTPYISVGCQNNKFEYKIYYAPTKCLAGVGAEAVIAKW